MSAPDLALWEKWSKHGDAEAFKEIAVRHAGMVNATCNRILGNATEAEDVAQECFEVLARTQKGPKAHLAAWLHSVATRRAIDRTRANVRRRDREKRFAAETTPNDDVQWDDIYTHLDEAVAELPEKLRQPIILHFFEGQTHDTIAQAMGVSRPAVTHRIKRGVEQIRKSLGRREVLIAGAALVSMMNEHAVAAVPKTLAVRLGKLALLGKTAVETAGWTAALFGRMMSLTKPIAVIGGIALAAGVLILAANRSEPASNAPATITVQPTPPSSVLPAAFADDEETSSDETPEPPLAATKQTESPVQPTPTGNSAPPAFAGISGLVLDKSENPISDATVRVSLDFKRSVDASTPMRTAQTNDSGEYEISGIELEGSLLVAASAVGYVDAVESVELALPEARSDVDFALLPGASFVAKVFATDGTPAGGAVVIPLAVRYRRGGGEFELERRWAVADGEGLVHIGFKDFGTADFEVRCLDRGSAVFHDVPLDEGELVEFRLLPPATLRGTVTATDGSPMAGYVVSTAGAIPEDGRRGRTFTRTSEGTVDEAGTYEIRGLAPNLSYWASVYTPNGSSVASFDEPSDVIPPGQSHELNCTMQVPATITGTIRGESSGLPISAYFIVYAVPEGQSAAKRFTWAKDEPSFTLAIEKPGTYIISASYAFFEEVPFEPETLHGHRVELESGQQAHIDLLVPDPVTIPVKVVYADGKPVKGARVRLCRMSPEYEGEFGALARAKKTDSNGRYTWRTKPGPEVWVQADIEGYNMTGSDHFVGTPGEIADEVKLVLRQPGNIQCQVLQANGAPAKNQGLTLDVSNPQGQRLYSSCFSADDHGHFLLERALRSDEVVVTLKATFENSSFTFPPIPWSAPADQGMDLGTVNLPPQS